MDKNSNIQEHSKIKLELYCLYLQSYLNILLNSGKFSEVFVHDIFAGSGISANGQKGSALLAALEIQKIQARYPKTPVYLRANEKFLDKFTNLEIHLKEFDFVKCFNFDANSYISSWKDPKNSHSLFFIDPHGYTQISADNLKSLFSVKNREFLIFIPIFHIYRFLYKIEGDYDQLKPVANFLEDFGIGEKEAKKVKDFEEFATLVVDALKKIANTNFAYKEIIKNRDFPVWYGLFFITNHHRGAEKFLEAQNSLQKNINAKKSQPSFDFIDDPNNKSIRKLIRYNEQYDNVSLYDLGLKEGISPVRLRKELEYLEEKGKIVVTAQEGKKRINKGFYLNYDRYTEDDKMISVIFKG